MESKQKDSGLNTESQGKHHTVSKSDIKLPDPNKVINDPFLQIQQRIKASELELQQAIQENRQSRDKLEITRQRYQDVEKRDKQLQAQLYNVTKNIKVTDDDFSTIVTKLGKFTGKLSNLPLSSRSAFKKEVLKQDLVDLFVGNSDEREKESIVALFDLEHDQLDYALVSVLVEKIITADIVKCIFTASIHLNPTINTAYDHINELFTNTNHQQWVKDIRLKLSRATHDAINKQSYPDADKLHAETRENLVNSIVKKLSVIYDPLDEIKTKIEKLVDMAIELSLPIRGQDDVLEIYNLYPGDEIYTSQIKPIYRQMNKDKIFLGITPVFLANSVVDDEYDDDVEEGEEGTSKSYLKDHTLVYQGKAIW